LSGDQATPLRMSLQKLARRICLPWRPPHLWSIDPTRPTDVSQRIRVMRRRGLLDVEGLPIRVRLDPDRRAQLTSPTTQGRHRRQFVLEMLQPIESGCRLHRAGSLDLALHPPSLKPQGPLMQFNRVRHAPAGERTRLISQRRRSPPVSTRWTITICEAAASARFRLFFYDKQKQPRALPRNATVTIETVRP
jgi:hypothetical protein